MGGVKASLAFSGWIGFKVQGDASESLLSVLGLYHFWFAPWSQTHAKEGTPRRTSHWLDSEPCFVSKTHFPYSSQLTWGRVEEGTLRKSRAASLLYVSCPPGQSPVPSCLSPLAGTGLGLWCSFLKRYIVKQWPGRWGQRASHPESCPLAYLLSKASDLTLLQKATWPWHWELTPQWRFFSINFTFALSAFVGRKSYIICRIQFKMEIRKLFSKSSWNFNTAAAVY